MAHIESFDCDWAERALTVGSSGRQTDEIESEGGGKGLRLAIGGVFAIERWPSDLAGRSTVEKWIGGSQSGVGEKGLRLIGGRT